MASTQSRSGQGLEPISEARPSRRMATSTACTAPCAREPVTSKASPTGMKRSPCSEQRMTSISSSGRCDRLPRLNPTWLEVTGALNDYSSAAPFRPPSRWLTTLLDDGRASAGLVLIAPAHLSLGAKPRSFQYELHDQPKVNGVRVSAVTDRWDGILHVKMYLRSFFQRTGDLPEELTAVHAFPINAQERELKLAFRNPLISARHDVVHRRCEIALVWEGAEGREQVELERRPELLY